MIKRKKKKRETREKEKKKKEKKKDTQKGEDEKKENTPQRPSTSRAHAQSHSDKEDPDTHVLSLKLCVPILIGVQRCKNAPHP